jgi:hypothetical protein
VQLRIFKARLTKIEKLKDIKHELANTKTRENWQETYKKTSSFSKNLHGFFMNMVAEKLWNKNFYAWRFGFGFDKSVAPDNDRFMFRSAQKHIKINLF